MMSKEQDYGLLSLYVYSVRNELDNRPILPVGWKELELKSDNILLSGFSYGVFRNETSGEIVMAFAGTNERIDWVSNVIAGIGLVPAPQISAAAVAYMRVKAAYGDGVTFTGHSLGGGQASVMATWFDRPAVIFDAAPFQLTAVSPTAWTLVGAALGLAGYNDPAFARAIVDFGLREQKVQHYYIDGEALLYLRASLPVVAGSETPLQVGGLGLNSVQLHSMALYAAASFSPEFVQASYLSDRILPRIMDEKLYAYDVKANVQRNFLIDLIRSNQDSANKLSNFSKDILKLGSGFSGLSQSAQDAIIAQTIEWYYWQNNSTYAGSEFFNATGNLVQYTTAVGDGLSGALNKSSTYVNKWLTQLYNQNGEFGGRSNFDQWNVAVSDNAAIANALDASKTQIFIGGVGSDNFTGGSSADIFFGSGGNDFLSGEQGNDILYGGADDDTMIGGTGADMLLGGTGNDTYIFKSGDGSDVIRDEDGQGHIEVDGQTLIGGNKRAAGAWVSGDGKFEYTLVGNSAGQQDLIIGHAGQSDRIVVQNWQAGQLGITLNDTPATTNQPTNRFVGDFAPEHLLDTANVYYFNYDAYGNLVPTGVAEPGRADVLFGTPGNDELDGKDGNDSLMGDAGDDVLDGGAGDDLISGGAGQDIIHGGDGMDFIFGGATYSGTSPLGTAVERPYVPQPGAAIVGATWSVAFRGASGQGASFTLDHIGIDDPSDVGDIIDAGAGNDYVDGGYGDDVIAGGDGNDGLRGGAGNDVIDGGTGDDHLMGDNWGATGLLGSIPSSAHGNDVLSGGDGADTLIGQGGNDELYGGNGDDTLMGDNRDLLDTPVDVAGQDTLDGGAGNDVLVGGAKEDVLIGGDGNDSLWGDDTAETLDGAFHADDSLDGGAGNDELTGGGGADVLVGGEGNDKLFGDEQSNKLGVQYQGDDTLDGGAGNDIMQAGTGHDWLQGGAGDDTLVGSDDLLSPGSSDWAALFAAHGRAYAGNSDLNAYQNVLLGGDGNDTIIGGAGRNCLQGDAGVYGYTRVAANDERFLAVA
jgi:Ca2+-binding RTX toxin-like protein